MIGDVRNFSPERGSDFVDEIRAFRRGGNGGGGNIRWFKFSFRGRN